jgi:hypothetical protein
MADDLLLLRSGDHLLLRAGDKLKLRAGAVTYKAAHFRPHRQRSSAEVTGVNWNAGLNRDLQLWHIFLGPAPESNASQAQQRELVRRQRGICSGFSNQTFTKPRRPGALGAVLGYDGIDDHINWGEISPGRCGSGDMTVSFWFYVGSGTATGTRRVVQYRGTGTFGTQPGWQICYTASSGVNIDSSSGFDNGSTHVAWGAALLHPQSEWHHHTHTFKRDGNWTLYIDGVSKSTLAISSVTGSVNAAAGRQLAFGHADVTHGQHMFGRLDDVRIYHRALSAGEVRALYQASATGYPNELLRNRVVAIAAEGTPPPPPENDTIAQARGTHRFLFERVHGRVN